jgi:hypothetical protein
MPKSFKRFIKMAEEFLPEWFDSSSRAWQARKQ